MISSVVWNLLNAIMLLQVIVDVNQRFVFSWFFVFLNCTHIIGHSIGRQAMLACNVIPSLAQLFDDTEPSVRRNAHKAVSMYSEAPPGIEFDYDTSQY